jgi:hypothetical protein
LDKGLTVNGPSETERMSGRRGTREWFDFKVSNDEVVISNVLNRAG